MTTTFDALMRMILAYKERMKVEDVMILKTTIDTLHDLQHNQNNHELDGVIERAIKNAGILDRFQQWRRGDIKDKDIEIIKKERR